MSDWNDIYGDRDGLPRGYVLAAPDQYEPVAPSTWMRFDGDVGVHGAVLLADAHRMLAGALDPMDVRVLARRYSTVTAEAAVAARSWLRITLSPTDAYAMPIGLAMKVFRAGTRERGDVALLGASVRGQPQCDGMRMYTSSDVDADARGAWLSSRDIDRGRAWPTDGWQCFSNAGLGNPMEICLVNPHRETMDVELFLFYIGFHTFPSRVPGCASGIGGPFR